MPNSSRFPLRVLCLIAVLAIPMQPAIGAPSSAAKPPAAAAAKPTTAAVPAANPYEAVVPVEDESDKSRDKGLRLALIEVLRRVVGRSDAASSQVLSDASRLVQQYGFLRDEASGAVSFRAVFDPRGVEDALKAQGLPVFGLDSDVVEAWVVQVSGVRSADDYARVVQHLTRLRGVRRLDVAELGDQGMRLRMIVEGGMDRVVQLAEAGGVLRRDGAGNYVYTGR